MHNRKKICSFVTLWFFISLAILAIGSAGSPILSKEPLPSGFETVGLGIMAPKTTFFDEGNALKDISVFSGKIVVLNFWATWCAPCVKEMPSLDQLASILPSDRFAIVAVSQDKGGIAVARPFLERLGIKRLATYVDPNGRLPRDYGGRGMPTTFVIGPQGKIISRLEGSADWNSEEIKSYLLSLLE